MPVLNFKGKTFVLNHHLAVRHHQLVPKKKLSLTKQVSLHDNLIIHGDNLKALKALLPTYGGKVKCIYIDPPYNTGNEGWAYNDNVASPMIQEWLNETLRGNKVDKEDMTRHDKWLCMMFPRLKLLHELLAEDGVIFVSIDDNEVHHLRAIMDEIFGEENFVSNFIWQKKTGASDANKIAVITEYVLCYTKTNNEIGETFSKNKESHDISRYKYEDQYISTRGNYYIDNLDRGGLQYSDSMNFAIICPDGSLAYPNGREEFKNDGWIWKWGKKKVEWAIENGFLEFRKSSTKQSGWSVCYKNYLFVNNANESITRSAPIKNVITEILNANSASEIKQIFNEENSFNYPKPKELIKKLLNSVNLDKNSIILDSFAGSGTTAHAVLELNKEDGGNRKFILIEQEDYASTITAERVRRVINGVPLAKNENLKNGLGGQFSYFELGDAIETYSLLSGENLPAFEELARYVFYTATGVEFDLSKINYETSFIGQTEKYELYMLYKPDLEWLKTNALTMNFIKNMPKFNGKQRLVFAPAKYVDDETCESNRIDFCQLPYQIYRLG